MLNEVDLHCHHWSLFIVLCYWPIYHY